MKNKRTLVFVVTLLFLSVAILFYLNPIVVILGEKNKFYFVNTETLDLSENHTKLGDEEKLIYFKDLTRLNLRGCKLQNIEFLNELHDLKEFQFGYFSYASSTDNIDLSPLMRTDGLTVLGIIGVDNADISVIGNLKYLQELEISFSSINFEMMQSISSMQSLKKLDLSNSTVSSLYPLQDMNNLEVLCINNMKNADAEELLTLSQVKELHICDTQIDDISRLSLLENLNIIYVTKYQYTKLDLEFLRSKGIEVIEV